MQGKLGVDSSISQVPCACFLATIGSLLSSQVKVISVVVMREMHLLQQEISGIGKDIARVPRGACGAEDIYSHSAIRAWIEDVLKLCF